MLADGGRVRVTGIERTLIDIAVRPAYSGGVGEVAHAYVAAKGRFSSNRLSAMLSQLDFTYPYEQVIGFYLQRADYPQSAIHLFRRKSFKFDFYLAHGMRETEYVKEWRLFVPRGF